MRVLWSWLVDLGMIVAAFLLIILGAIVLLGVAWVVDILIGITRE